MADKRNCIFCECLFEYRIQCLSDYFHFIFTHLFGESIKYYEKELTLLDYKDSCM